jgi:hypothetical protein
MLGRAMLGFPGRSLRGRPGFSKNRAIARGLMGVAETPRAHPRIERQLYIAPIFRASLLWACATDTRTSQLSRGKARKARNGCSCSVIYFEGDYLMAPVGEWCLAILDPLL